MAASRPTASTDHVATLGRPADLTAADVRWLAWHEARSHALIGREVRELGDAVLLYDETDREPFWNRLAGIAWPSEPAAFDRRLAEAIALFAGLDRIPHVWPTPGFDEPLDLTARLLAHGFEDHGGGLFMVLDPDRMAPPPLPPAPASGVTIERLHGVTGQPAIEAARAIAARPRRPSTSTCCTPGPPGRDRARGGPGARDRGVPRHPDPGRRRAGCRCAPDHVRGWILPVVDRDGAGVPRARPRRARHRLRGCRRRHREQPLDLSRRL